jgi:crossover junction endodeoxyribonuclease RuvC
MYYIGADPGKQGAISVIDSEDNVIYCDDLPYREMGDKYELDSVELLDSLAALKIPFEMLAVERVQAIYDVSRGFGDTPRSSFTFGKNYGALLATLNLLNVRRFDVIPQTWKKHYGLIKTTKEDSRLLALKFFPDAPIKRKKDDGRAESLLIAKWVKDAKS